MIYKSNNLVNISKKNIETIDNVISESPIPFDVNSSSHPAKFYVTAEDEFSSITAQIFQIIPKKVNHPLSI